MLIPEQDTETGLLGVQEDKNRKKPKNQKIEDNKTPLLKF